MRSGGAVTALLLALAGVAKAQAPADTLYEGGGLLDRLQREDEDFFSDELFDMDPALQDSALARLDSLGYETAREEAKSNIPLLDLDAGIATKLVTFNRVEGLAAGLSAGLHSPKLNHFGLEVQAAYATASEKVRYYGEFSASFPVEDGTLMPRAGYEDRVVPFGSNRPVANGVRALLFSDDDQDYLRHEGGFAALRFDREALTVDAGYEAADETSVGANTERGLFAKFQEPRSNPPVDEGRERAIFAGVKAGGIVDRRERIDVAYRLAGGSLGGDFAYTTFAVQGAARRYVGTMEVVLDACWRRVGGEAPVQRLADLGSLSTVRGFERRSLVGKAAVNARAEVLLPYDLFRAMRIPLLKDAHLQFIPWGDAGRLTEGPVESWMASLGIGVQKYLGPFGRGSCIRLDVAFPTGPDRPEDVRFYLYFARGYF